MMQMQLRRYRAWLGTGLAAILLAACATPQKIGRDSSDAAFERAGRFAVSVNYFGGRHEAVQGGFAWRDAGNTLTLDLANPLGNTLARVEVEPGMATLTRSNGEREQAAHPDALVEQVLGSPIPVSGLRDWLRGRAGQAGVSGLQKNEQGQIGAFSQDGWRVQLSRYDGQGPALLQMNRNESNRNISVRLVIDE
jgi:outer membrane lipoprotein LolB